MPDPVVILTACVLAALAAAGIRVVAQPARTDAGGVLAVGLGLLLGCLMLGLQPRFPPREDLDRFLLILLPLVLGVELLAALPGWLPARYRTAERGLVWLLRAGVAASAAFILLYNSSYVAELAGPGSRAWSADEIGLTLTLLGGSLIALWGILTVVARVGPARSAPLALAVAAAGGAITVMLSGVATNGQLGLALTAALVGAVVLPGPLVSGGSVSVGAVGLFALVMIGRFFGELTTLNAALVFFAPALCAIPELPYLRKMWPALRVVVAVLLAAAPVAVALTLAQDKPAVERPATDTPEPGLSDYLEFGK